LVSNMETVTEFLGAIVILLGLVAILFWLSRRLIMRGRVGGGPEREQHPRLAIIEAAVLDGRRRLILVRRDNIEHLMMIGGPTNVVIEQNIVHAVPEAQPRQAPRAAEPEPMVRPHRAPRLEPEPPPKPIPRQRSPQPKPMPGASFAEPPPFRPRPTPRPAPAAAAPESMGAQEPGATDARDIDLEPALRRLATQTKPPSPQVVVRKEVPDVAPAAREPARAEAEPPRLAAADRARAAPAPKQETRPASPKSVLDSLEQEFASLSRREAARVEPDLDMKEFEPDSSGPKDPAKDSS